MSDIQDLFTRNRLWAQRVKQANPDFFLSLWHQQRPEYLWIGCADSRVPANEIVDLPPGEVFVHRNIANVVVHSDLNCLSVIQYAVEVLKVKHIIVCGHYNCGGVQACLSADTHGLIDNWLRHIKDVHRMNADLMDTVTDESARADLLCELNVIEQVRNVCTTTIVRDAWRRGMDLTVNGWVYSVKNGVLENLCSRQRDSTELCLDPDWPHREALSRPTETGI